MLSWARRLSTTAPKYGDKVLYSATLHLPKTSFGPKIPANQERELLIQQSSQDLYQWQKKREGNLTPFVLHDGPPYANGDLHLGHALNKILKDIINRHELLYKNSKIAYVPGWDCHGLPIEMKAILGLAETRLLSPVEIRKACRELASSMIDRQKAQFRDFGIMADFSEAYITMEHKYEARQLLVFLKILENGLLSRQLKPVWWGCETRTALAEAELEYNPKHTSVAVYVKYPAVEGSHPWLESIRARFGAKKISFLIWTSTPWTIPANKAICVNQDMQYCLLHNEETAEYVVVACELAEAVLKLNTPFAKVPEYSFPGSQLVGMSYTSPVNGNDEIFPVVHGSHVVAGSGSGLVHTAPAHGHDDYLVGKQHGLEIDLCVDDEGRYKAASIPSGWRFMAGELVSARATVKQCVTLMEEAGMVFHVTRKYVHSYPYDWRSKTPVIQRATPQWFVNVDKIKAVAVEALENVEFIPESGKNRLPSFITNRNEWCISRQRTWGVPLPIVYHKQTGEPLDDLATVTFVVQRLQEFGTDQWFEEESDILRWVPSHINGNDYYKGKDTMDVWFDSGTSWTSLKDNVEDAMSSKTPLADVYLEGSDQHRGWFQLSLLNKIIASGLEAQGFQPVAPFAKIITHGFTLDSKNDKMSKSRGNTILPQQVIHGGGKPLLPLLGTDGLRLWAASSAYTQDVAVSSEVLQRVFENVKKLRVTFKYLLGNLHDFLDSKAVDYKSLGPLDRWVLSRLHGLQELVSHGYSSHSFAKVVKEINSHVSTDLSSLYFDVSKDCLYTDKADGLRRRSIQTVLAVLLRTYIGLLAPIQPLLVEEVWAPYRALFGTEAASPFMVGYDFYQLPDEYRDIRLEGDFDKIWAAKNQLYRFYETLRAEGYFKNKLETQIVISGPGSSLMRLLLAHSEYLDDYFLVSKVVFGEVLETEKHTHEVVVGNDRVVVAVQASQGEKCPRCWKHIAEEKDHLCAKCHGVVN